MLTAPALLSPALPVLLLSLDAFAPPPPPLPFSGRPSPSPRAAPSATHFVNALRLSLASTGALRPKPPPHRLPARPALDPGAPHPPPACAHTRRLIRHAASFLEGAAWRWWCRLLRANVGAFFALEARRLGRAPVHVPRLEEGGGDRPAYWASYPFVLPELGSLDAFLEALEAEFPPASVETADL